MNLSSSANLRRLDGAIPRPFLTVITVAIVIWCLVVIAKGADLLRTVIAQSTAEAPIPTLQLTVAAGTIGLCLVVALMTRWLRPSGTFPSLVLTSTLMLLVATLLTGSLLAWLPALLLLTLATALGDAVVARLTLLPLPPLVRLPLAASVGLALLGLLLFPLALLTALTPPILLTATLLLALLLLATNHARWRTDLAALRSWQPVPPTWFVTLLAAFGTGILTYALFAALVPETMATASDAMRQHLPIAREIWQASSIPTFPQLYASNQPILGHLLYALAYGAGGPTAAKLLQASLGITTICCVASLAWLATPITPKPTAPRTAAGLAGLLVATIPLTLWIVGHLYPDLLAVLFVVAAATAILAWMRDGNDRWLLLAGLLAGSAFATKVAAALFLLTFATALLLVGREPKQWLARLRAAVLFGVSAAVIVVPWMLRSYLLVNSTLITPQLNRSDAIEMVGGVARTPLGILLGPWTLTFDGVPRSYRVILEGELGLALLLLLPLAFLPPFSRPKTFLVLAMAASYLGWTFSGQTGRHLLPTLALAAALLALSVASLPPPSSWSTHLAAFALRTGLLAATVASLLFVLPNATTRLPVDLLLGRQSTEAFLQQETWAYNALSVASQLPPDTRVGYISLWEGPQAATEVRLVFLGTFSSPGLDAQLGTTPEQILASLQAQGLRYLIWDRTNTRLQDWTSTLLSSDFLRTHTRLLAGDANAYLFEILSESDPDRPWGLGLGQPQSLLANPDFQRLNRAGSSWVLTPPDAKVSREKGALLLRRDATLSQTVPVTPGQSYLLTASMRCPTLGLAPSLTLAWHDAEGTLLRTDVEPVYPGPTLSTQFLFRVAPHEAATATVKLGEEKGQRCGYFLVQLLTSS